MGLLVPIVHEGRVDQRTATRVARALGNATLHVGALRPTRDRLDHLLANLVPDSASTIHFEHGHHLPLELLHTLVDGDGGGSYVDIGSVDANLRVWSDRAWVHVTPMPLAGLGELATIVHEIFDVDVPATPGEHRLGALEVDLAQRVSAATIRTPDRALAVRFFARTCGPRQVMHGHVSSPTATQLPQLAAFHDLAHATVTISAELAPEVVADLLDDIPCSDWQCDDLAYDYDDERLYTYRVAPVHEADARAWRAKVAAALAT